MRHGFPDGQLVHGSGDQLGLAQRSGVERADHRVATGLGLHEAGLFEPGERLTDRRTADTEPVREVSVVQTFAGRELTFDNCIADGPIGVLAQQ